MLTCKKVLGFFAVMTISASVCAQEIKLPQPQIKNGPAVMQIMAKRQSAAEYDTKMISEQTLSNLLWATIGINRPNGKLTSPTAHNKQEIRLFVFTETGVSEYLPKTNALKMVVKGDYRALVAAQQPKFKAAPVSLVLVADMDKYGDSSESAKLITAIDAGIACENISVAAAGLGLAARPRISMETEKIQTLLGLNKNQIPVINNVIGYPVKK